MDFKTRWMDAPVKPLHLTSTGNVNALHPASSIQLISLHTIPFSASIPSSHGTVSSNKMTNIIEVDQSMMSGQIKVVVIS